MGLKGSGFLAIWHDIALGAEDAYVEWHTREHMPERLSIPGFHTGKRLRAPGAERHVFGTIYAGEHVEVFRSPAYLARLNNPTAWTAAVAPAFQNFLRIACERLASAGAGDGGGMATIRLDFTREGAAEELRARACELARAMVALPGACAAHVGLARREVSAAPTRETEIRAPMAERGFDAVLLVEGSSPEGLAALIGEAERLALRTGLLTAPESHVYAVDYSLTADDLKARA